MSFIFGGTTGQTYEDIQRRRKIAQSVIAQNNSRQPRNVGEGLVAVGNALMGRAIEKRASRQEAELRERGQEVFSSALSGDRMGQLQALGNPALNDQQRRIIEAQMAYNERQRVRGASAARTASANQRQVDARNAIAQALVGQMAPKPGVQMGPTAAAADAGATSGADLGTLQTERIAPGREQIVQQLIGNPNVSVNQIGDVLDLLPEPEQEPELPAAYQTLEARARAGGLEQGSPEFQQFMLSNGQPEQPQPQFRQVRGSELGLVGKQADVLFNVGPDNRVSQIGGGGTNISLRNEGSIPPGYRAVRDDAGSISNLEAIPGGPVAREIEAQQLAAESAAQTAQRNAATRGDVVSGTVSQMRNMLNEGGPFDLPEVGIIGSRISGINQESADMAGMIDSLKGAVAFDRIDKLKQASETGASGLGPVSNVEIGLLSSSLGALDQNLSRDAMLRTLDTIDDVLGKMSAEALAYLTGQTDSLPSNPENGPNSSAQGASGLSQIESELRAEFPDMFEN